MSTVVKFAILAMLAFIPCNAFADQSWVCSYTDISQNPVITKYTIQDGLLIGDGKDNLKYKVLQNNDYSVIATSTISAVESEHSKPSIGFSTIIINKRNMRYKIVQSPMNGDDDFMAAGDQTINGDCIKN